MVRVLVVEDEPLARQHLVKMLAELPGVRVVGEARDGAEGLRSAVALRPDALFLDIRMPGMDGLELMKLLPEPRPALVFTTAHQEHALAAFEGGVVHYLLKPITRVGLAQALSRISPKQDPLQQAWLRIPVRMRGARRLLAPEEVDALIADLGDCLAWTAEGPLRVEGTLGHWEERLADHGFQRTHRNALVRLAAVREVTDTDELVLPSGRLQVSKRRMEEVKKALGL